MNPENKKPARRGFLLGVGAAGAAAGAAAVVARSAAPVAVQAKPEPATADPAGKGYRLTEHVKRYYRTTTV